MNRNFVVFDFCETLITFQTADRFVDFIIECEGYNKYRGLRKLTTWMVKFKLLAIIAKLYPELNLSKRLKLYQIKGLSRDFIKKYAEKYYYEILIKNRIDVLSELLINHKKNGDHILIVSGGYAPYIKYFSELHGVNSYFATEIEFVDEKVSGKFLGKDCLYQQKVKLIDFYIKRNKIEFDESIAYSDSITDLPLLKWANSAYVVSKGQSQKWAKEYGFNEIVWNQ